MACDTSTTRMTAADPHDLARFVAAQADVWAEVVDELGSGRKRSHWMWFVFPQHVALGRSATARRFGIRSRAEAAAYRAHPLLGPRLLEGTRLVLAVQGRSAHAIFGSPDDLKFRSSMTLFAAVDPHEPAFAHALERYAGGAPDAQTLALLAAERSAPA